MTAKIIDGRAVSAAIRSDLKIRVQALAKKGTTPGLAVIMVGANPASAVYVRNKIRACGEVGIRSFQHNFPADADPKAILDLIEELNTRKDTHGILVQLPLPPQFSISEILQTISADKDVDGFHLYNVGGLVVGDTVFPPCTPYGVVKLLEHEGIEIEGKNVVVVGASNIVGKPMALMLMQRDATVAICHAKTRDLAQFTILADILVVAAGKPNLIVPQMVKTGAVVIDVGINRLPDGRLVGDTIFPPCTPYGVVKLLEHENIEIEGKNVVVVGASNIVGKPMALMLMQREATVAICHAKTRDLAQFTILADILVVAAGRPNLIVPQMVKAGAVVIDVGINRLPDGRLVGDTDFEGLKEKASYITPVPGGVGPMTVTMLLFNTIASAERQAAGNKVRAFA